MAHETLKKVTPIMSVTPITHNGVYAYEIITFYCPGCDVPHQIRHQEGHWSWNRDLDRPTISPSIKVIGPPKIFGKPDTVCHSFVTDGNWVYLQDCTHDLRGQTVPLPPLPDEFLD